MAASDHADDQKQALLGEDRGDEAPLPDEMLASAGVAAEASQLEAERSPLSRRGSLSNLLEEAATADSRQLTLCEKAGTGFAATLMLGMLATVAIVLVAVPAPFGGGTPRCRRAATIAVAPAGANVSQAIVVWSGRGQGGTVYHDWLHVLSLTDYSWRKVKSQADQGKKQQQQPPLQEQLQAPQQPPQQQQQQQQQQQGPSPSSASLWHPTAKPPAPLPHGRWKAAVTTLGSRAMLVHGGDAPDQPGETVFMGDTWLLDFGHLRWSLAAYTGSGGNSSSSSQQADRVAAPSARHSHTLVSFTNDQGQACVLLFGGHRGDGVLLSDVWQGTVSWPNISWTLLHDPQTGVGQGPAPLPRSGHAAVMLNDSAMLVHGGRSEVYGSFSDVWLFSLADLRWQPLTPSTSAQPAPRDLHAAAAYGGKLLVFGGRYGTLYEASRPLGDRWLFDLRTRTWSMLPVRGLSPLPRFLFASTQYTPAGEGAHDRLLVFGGETGGGCALNDAWQLDLLTHRWQQLSLATFASKQCKNLFG